MSDVINNIIVSVAMITYNHEKYIAQALESVLMQKVSFKYEIVIGDDCSPDNTQLVIREYAEKYPDKINAILRTENLGGINNLDDVLKKCRGKYLIILEGDDYWTDTDKLQIQHDFLASHPEYIAVSHWCEVVDEKGNISNEVAHKYYTFNFYKNVYSLQDYQKNFIPGHINTILFRNMYLETDYDYTKIYNANTLVGDRTLFLILVLLGDVYVYHKIISHYRYVRKVGNTNHSSQLIGKNGTMMFYDYFEQLERSSYEIMGREISLRSLKYPYFFSSIKVAIKNPTDTNIDIVKKIYRKMDKWELMKFLPFELSLHVIAVIKRRILH